MKIPVKFLNFNKDAPDTGYWDHTLLTKIFNRDEFVITTRDPSQAIIVIPATQNIEHIGKINDYIANMDAVIVILTGGEEGTFPTEALRHPKMKVWLMAPHPNKAHTKVDRFIGFGITPHCDQLPTEVPEKDLKWFFSGQITHRRRKEVAEVLRKEEGGELIETSGFSQGIEPTEYIKRMARAKIVPCPAGPMVADSFRFYEALEAGCIPIADGLSPHSGCYGYWELLFGNNIPFPIAKTWDDLHGLLSYYNDTFDSDSNKIFAWWQNYKREIVRNLVRDFNFLTIWNRTDNNRFYDKQITVVVPTSPTKSNPDTSIIEETIATIRAHLPKSDIIVTFDGVRPEQEYLKSNYQEYTRKLLWKMNREWRNVYPIIFEEHTHQVGMLRKTLDNVDTEFVLYVEHDTPLTPDCSIPWERCAHTLHQGYADLIRFHYEAYIPEPHEYLMLDRNPIQLGVIPAVRTIQWSQRPHLASVDFYRRILRENFSADAKTFIEDKMHSVVIEAYKREQKQGWNKFKLCIYHPEDGNIKRSYHLDGRGDEQKYEMTF